MYRKHLMGAQQQLQLCGKLLLVNMEAVEAGRNTRRHEHGGNRAGRHSLRIVHHQPRLPALAGQERHQVSLVLSCAHRFR